MRYTVVLFPEPEVGGFTACVPAVGVVTQGDSVEHALAMAADAAGLKLEVMAEDGEAVPIEPPGAIIGSIDVSLPDIGRARTVRDGGS